MMREYSMASEELEQFKDPDYSKVPSKKAMKGVLYVFISLLLGLIAYVSYILVYIRGWY